MKFQCPVKSCSNTMGYQQRMCPACFAKLPEAHQRAIKEASHRGVQMELTAIQAAVRWLESNDPAKA